MVEYPANIHKSLVPHVLAVLVYAYDSSTWGMEVKRSENQGLSLLYSKFQDSLRHMIPSLKLKKESEDVSWGVYTKLLK